MRTYVECCPLEFRRFRPFLQRVKVVLPTLVYPADVIVDKLLSYSTVHVCMYNPFDYTYFLQTIRQIPMRAPSHSHPCYNPHHDCRQDTNVQLDARIAFSLSASRIFFAAGTGVEQDLLPDEGDALAGGDGAGQDPLPDGIVGDRQTKKRVLTLNDLLGTSEPRVASACLAMDAARNMLLCGPQVAELAIWPGSHIAPFTCPFPPLCEGS